MRISDEDEAFLRKWFEGIAGKDGFEKNYRDFMGADPSDESRPGSNRRILNDFIDAKKHQPLAAYALSVYSHTAAGDRARWAFRGTEIAIIISLATAGVALLAKSNPVLVGGILIVYGAGFALYLKIKWRRQERLFGKAY